MLQTTHVLMCPPTYFDIEYSINPWMDTANRVDSARAARQWQAAYALLDDLGVAIDIIAPQAGLPDMTFAGDAGMVVGRRFLASNFRHAERQGEVAPFASWLRAHDYEICSLPENTFFEGLGDIIFYENDIIFGYGPRSSPDAIDHVRAIFPELNLVGELYLGDESFYHTALAAAFLDHDALLYYPPAFDAQTQAYIRDRFPASIPVGERDAREYFVCNNIMVGKTMLMDNCSPALARQLEERGLQIVCSDMSEFKKSGGSIRCLILNI